MMEMLYKHEVNGNYNEELKRQLEGELRSVNAEISSLYTRRKELNRALLELEIAPFKIGGYALVEITSGRNSKWQKCLLEYEKGVLFARPVKEDGSLSGRHYSLLSIYKPYSELLKEVE